MKAGESLAFIVDTVFEESLVSDSSANTASTEKPIWTDFLLRDNKLQLKHSPASIKGDINLSKRPDYKAYVVV